MPTPQQYKKLRDALISAFPEKSRLEQMLYFELGRKLNEITRDSDLQDITFKLIQTAEAHGWLLDLVRAARKENSGNLQLQAIALELLPPEPPAKSQQKILVLADISLNQEIQKIECFIKGAVKPHSFEIKIRIVVSPQDIRKALGEERPEIVHFCVQSTQSGDLVLKDHQGNDRVVEREILAELFKWYVDAVKCVLVNTSYSFPSAKAISQHINYVISLEQSIQEEAAIVFAEGFYNWLRYNDINNSSIIARAFHEGIVALKLDSSKGMIPDLWNQSVLEVGDLSSDRSVDYTRLRDLLKAGQWKDADYQTYLVMLKVVGREKGDWIRDEELLNFPCTDLRTIDRLWVKYSNGRFGFSVQKKIYLEVGGIPDGKFYKEAWKKFGDRVGWRVKEIWISYTDVTFDTIAPVGHLPYGPTMLYCTQFGRYAEAVEILFSRIQTCKV